MTVYQNRGAIGSLTRLDHPDQIWEEVKVNDADALADVFSHFPPGSLRIEKPEPAKEIAPGVFEVTIPFTLLPLEDPIIREAAK